jgi:hypothetical protein
MTPTRRVALGSYLLRGVHKIATALARRIGAGTTLGSFFGSPGRDERKKLLSEKYLAGENLTADEMNVLRLDWAKRFSRGITDEGYGRRKIIRIPRDGEGALDWFFPLPQSESEWQELGERLGMSVDDLRKLMDKNR